MITKEQKYNLLVSALEGGSNYWYLIDKDGSDIVYEYSGGTFIDKLWNALLNGRFIPFKDVETKEDLGELSLMGLSHAEILMRDVYPYHYADAVSENDDAITADVFLQLAIMKDVIYG